MASYGAGTVTVNGRVFPLYVDPESSQPWRVDFQGSTVYGKDIEKLKTAVAAAVRQSAVKINVPFSVTSESGKIVKRGVAYAKHGGNGNIMVRWASGAKEQMSYYENVMPALTEGEERTWLQLQRDADAAQKALREFERSRRFRLSDAVDKAIKEAESPS